ncbi:protein translocase subunit SecD [Synechococcus sp. RSCCF101]|uniref:protein translocase subunit SecD n=1 Tax=Synechococcus sp. RSCCF101 TaxID=2511069 RepID=UPI001243CD1F|nr:protein translocase subunit SecD [Synechococcus sp. RSCCF101]QEY31584.1 protein translocase subunit SecD [Synechococcus sp. RSCCF101]
MARQQGWFALILALAIAAASVLTTFPLQLGLDLRGGSQLTLKALPAGSVSRVGPEELEAVQLVLERRINGLGVAESTLRTVGDDQLVLELPGEQDPTRAARVLGSTALLEFRAQREGTEESMRSLLGLRAQARAVLQVLEEGGSGGADADEPTTLDPEVIAELSSAISLDNDGQLSERDQLRAILQRVNEEIVALYEPAELTGKDLVTAGRQQEQNSQAWEVTLTFNREGGEAFAELTRRIAGTGRLLGIVLDGRSISEASVGPQFQAAGITGGGASITGRFTAEEARDLEVQLRGGALPLPILIQEVRTIGPTLGAANIRRSLVATLGGLALVAVFMVLIYRLSGVVAVVALALYALFNLAMYALVPVTLTLPGMAGFILSVGMAVDANVLIFERVKEELRGGNTLIRSIDAGFSLAFSSILDGHLTTLISCVALFSLGIGLVKGFALTLGIGVILSLFTALTCTRTLLRLLMSYKSLRRPELFLSSSQLPAAPVHPAST